VVEASAEVVERFTDHQRPVVGRRLSLNSEAVAEDLFRRTHFTLYAEYVCASVFEGFGFRADRVYVFYAPVELPLGRGLSHELTSS